MKFFDSCVQRVTLADVARDIANDERFERHLKYLHELPPEAKRQIAAHWGFTQKKEVNKD